MTIREFVVAFWQGKVAGPGRMGQHVVMAKGDDGRWGIIFRGVAPVFVPEQEVRMTAQGAAVTPPGR